MRYKSMLRYVCVQFEGVVLCVSFFVRETSHKVQPIPMNIPRARVRACAAKMCRMCVCVGGGSTKDQSLERRARAELEAA